MWGNAPFVDGSRALAPRGFCFGRGLRAYELASGTTGVGTKGVIP